MATSGSTNFNTTRAEIVYFALRQVQGIERGETPDAKKSADAIYALNSMVKNLQATGLHVWTVTEGILFPAVDQVRYGAGGGATDKLVASYVETELSADEASGQTTLSVEDTDDITVADGIGITLDDGSLQWTTVSSKTASTVTIATALTDSAAEGAKVFTHTGLIGRPLKIVSARRYNIASGAETPIEVISYEDYQAIPNKTATGSINQISYNPQLSTGYVSIWQPPELIDHLVKFTWWRPIEDFDAAGDNPDLPQEWISALQWNLAYEFASGEYPVDDRVFKRIEKRAMATLDNVMGFDREEGPVYFQPATRGH